MAKFEENGATAEAFAQVAKPGAAEAKAPATGSGSYLSKWGDHRLQDFETHDTDVCMDFANTPRGKPPASPWASAGPFFTSSPE